MRHSHLADASCRFVENGSLGQTLKAFGRINEKLVSSYVRDSRRADYLHSQGVCPLTETPDVANHDQGGSLRSESCEHSFHEKRER